MQEGAKMLTKQDEIKIVMKNMDVEATRTKLEEIEPYMAHENNDEVTEEMRALMVKDVSQKMTEILEILKIDSEDSNVKDTPMRIASMWVNELMIGRYTSMPRIEVFENRGSKDQVIVKKCKVQSLCSHHFAPFFSNSNNDNSYCLVAYKPTDKLLGISKISRLVDWYARRPQLQESITTQIFDHLCELLGSDDVMVYIPNIIHTCELTRGSEDQEASTTTMVYGGIFDDPSVRISYLKY